MIEIFYDPKVLIPTITSIIAGAWILKDFILKREFYPKVEIDLDLNTASGPDSKGNYLAIGSIKIKNSGVARLYFKRAYFSVRLLEDGLDYHPKDIEGVLTVNFPNKLVDQASLFPKNWEYSFVDGGAENRYKFGIVIPSYSGSLLMKVKIFLPEKKSDFISEVAFFRWDGKGKLKKIKIGS
jgi:hypothetical protein